MRSSLPAKARRPVSRSHLPRDTVSLARGLLGTIVVRETDEGRISGRIVETEAYPVGDPAGHAYRGMTLRNRTLYLSHGHAYVYFIYGTSYMLNVSSEEAGIGAGVLIRALEPMEGIAIMQRPGGSLPLQNLTRGPGRLARALQIDRSLDGTDLCQAGPLWLARNPGPPPEIGTSVRIGISRGAERLLRFYIRHNPFVSGTRALNR